MLETVRQPLDHRVLETYPVLTELLGVREEASAVIDLVTSGLRQRLAQCGWRGQYVETPYVFTNGRVFIRGTSTQHGRKLRVDALLRAEVSLPIAVGQAIHAGQAREDVVRRLMEYAHHRLAVPSAYLLEEHGTLQEFDWTASDTPVHAVLTELPTRDALWNRWAEALGLVHKQARGVSPSVSTQRPEAALLSRGGYQSRGDRGIAGETQPAPAAHPAHAGNRHKQDEDCLSTGVEAEAHAGNSQCALPDRP